MEKRLQELLNEIIALFKILSSTPDRLVDSVYKRLKEQNKTFDYIYYINDIYRCLDIYDDLISSENISKIARLIGEYNDIVYKKELLKNDNLKKLEIKINCEDIASEPDEVQKEKITISKNEIILPNKGVITDADYYYDLILECKSDLLLIRDFINDAKQENKELIFKRVLLKIKMEVNQISKLLNDSDFNCSREEKELLFEEIYSLNELYDFINNSNYYDRKNQNVERRRLIFSKSQNDKIDFISDIERIPKEYYLSFLGLLESIENNRPLNFKIFNNNEALHGFMEVRGCSTRVIYTHLLDNFVLSKAYLKKCDWNSISQTIVSNAASNSKNYIEQITPILNDDNNLKSFYEEQEEINHKVKSYLKERAR
jgi:hypothetical protein